MRDAGLTDTAVEAALDAELAAHVAAANPHDGYLTTAEGAALAGTRQPLHDALTELALLADEGFEADTLVGRGTDPGDGAPQFIACTAAGRALLAGVDAGAQRDTLELGGSAQLDVGTAPGTVMAGNDARVVAVGSLVNGSLAANANTLGVNPTNFGSFVPQDGSVVVLIATVTAKWSAGAAGAAFHFMAAFRRVGAVVTQIGATNAVLAAKDNAAVAAVFVVAGTSIHVQVTGLAATSIDWTSSLGIRTS